MYIKDPTLLETSVIMTDDQQPILNTDKEIWREIPDDAYAPSIHVTEQNSIGINVGGTVYVKSVYEWHRLATMIHASTLMSDKGYQESTHEKQQEFAKKRNQQLKE
jgi:hypothetical protein